MTTRKLTGIEKKLVNPFLDTLARYGCSGVQMGSKHISKKGKDVIEETPDKKPKRRKPHAIQDQQTP